MTDAILEITDGTTTISLINPSSGFHLVSWVPAITDYKEGGVFTNPSLADWRQLRIGKWATAQENFGLHVNGANPDGVAFMLQELRRLLEKANAYWTADWQNTPVYLKVKARCETNTRYCLVVKGRLGNDRSYFVQPFIGGRSTMQDLPLLIERMAWLENAPGNGTLTEIDNLETFNGVNFGTVDSTGARDSVTALEDLYISGRRCNQNVTHIFNYDASATSFSANLLNTIPMTLFPASTAVGDIVYFGIQSSLTDTGPVFPPLVFDLSVAAAATSYAITWEIWSGSSWGSVSTEGDQVKFGETGIGTVNWKPPTQATTSINSVTAYWIRARLSSLTGAFTRPVQQNRNPYFANWPYFELQSTAIMGDIPALIQALFLDKGSDIGAPIDLQIHDLLIGLRSVDRGSNFTAYLNASDENNPTGITISLVVGSFVASGISPSGKIAEWTPAGTVANQTVWSIIIDQTIVTEYYGSFRAFLRVKQNSGSADDIKVRIELLSGGGLNAILTTEYQSVPLLTSPAFGILDFGKIEIPGGKLNDSELFQDFEIQVDAKVLATGGTLQLVDFILIPIDEFAISSLKPSNGPATESGQFVELDSVTYPKYHVRSLLKVQPNSYVIDTWETRSNNQFIAQSNTRQRYWVIFNAERGQSNVGINASVQVTHNAQYLSLRGNR